MARTTSDPEKHALAKRLREEAGLSEGYSYGIAFGKRKPGIKAALKIFEASGIKVGPLAQASAAQTKALDALKGIAA